MTFRAAYDAINDATAEANDWTYAEFHGILLEGTDMSSGDAEQQAFYWRLSRPAVLRAVAEVLLAASIADGDTPPQLERALRRLSNKVVNEQPE